MTIFHVIKYGELDPLSLKSKIPLLVYTDMKIWFNKIGVNLINADEFLIAKRKKFHDLLLAYGESL
jgi:hypothetical protein